MCAQRFQHENGIIGRNLRALRRGAGLSLDELARHLDISHQQVQKYEAGRNRLPLQYLPALCDLFGVPAEVFWAGLSGGSRMDDDIARVQICIARITDRTLRRKIIRILDILAA